VCVSEREGEEKKRREGKQGKVNQLTRTIREIRTTLIAMNLTHLSMGLLWRGEGGGRRSRREYVLLEMLLICVCVNYPLSLLSRSTLPLVTRGVRCSHSPLPRPRPRPRRLSQTNLNLLHHLRQQQHLYLVNLLLLLLVHIITDYPTNQEEDYP